MGFLKKFWIFLVIPFFIIPFVVCEWRSTSPATDQQAMLSHWHRYAPLEDQGSVFPTFSVRLPQKKPDLVEKTIPVPDDEEGSALLYREHLAYEHDSQFSVGQMVLPSKWTERWGNQLVLKGALKFLIKAQGSPELIGKRGNRFKQFPSLDYQYIGDSKHTFGTLILVNQVLYKVEMVEPVLPSLEEDQLLVRFNQFIQTLELGEGENGACLS